MSKGKDVEDLPLCESTEGKECELVKGWEDEFGEVHTEPFYLYPENQLAMEIYERTIQISLRQQMKWGKDKNRKEANMATLDKLDFIIEHYLPEDYTKTETVDLIDSVVLIYNLRMKYNMN